MRTIIRIISTVAMIVLIAIFCLVSFYSYNLPDSYFVTRGTKLNVSTVFDVKAFSKNKIEQSDKSSTDSTTKNAVLKLFGIIPIKEVKTKIVDVPVLVPGGNPFGIKILSDGVMVVGVGDVETVAGFVSPATNSGIQVGDVIISIDGEKIISNESISDVISDCNGEYVVVKLKRQNRTIEVKMKPEYSLSEDSYKAGMWVRDSSAGIGTITFYDPQTGKFGGLGHPVCDVDTGEIIPLSSGEVVGVKINGFNKGFSGQPGELLGSFISNKPIGSLELNNQSGLFGDLESSPNVDTIQMGFRQEITTGSAVILTTISGSKPKEYSIEIEKIDLKDSELSKNMIIKITDKELIEQTGGILQGMSGSPIIQNGKLVGAVTHVFVNEPTKGYAIFADTMYGYTQNLSEKSSMKLAS